MDRVEPFQGTETLDFEDVIVQDLVGGPAVTAVAGLGTCDVLKHLG